MAVYLLRRGGEGVIVLALVSVLVFALIGLMPGDPIDLLISADPDITSEDAARLRALYGLDRPLYERYLAWLGDALRGDLGFSRLYSQRVTAILWAPLQNTVILMSLSLVLGLLVAIPLALVAARRPHGPVDVTVNLLAFAGFSVPAFWLALLLILLFAVTLGWLPAGGVHAVGDPSLESRLRHLVLPVLTLTVLNAGVYLRFTRGALLEVLNEDFMRTARAKGLGLGQALLRHALPNAMLPLTTVVALHVGTLLSGALVVEVVFAYRGMGKLTYDAILANDFNLAMAALLLATGLTLTCNILADAVYSWLDPRVRYDD
ncbi:MAG: ABC transporter permease [Geminicoccaceae bacterium]|nr:MAG: ABC transporter permease [Geminicoccaceae bacterium]